MLFSSGILFARLRRFLGVFEFVAAAPVQEFLRACPQRLRLPQSHGLLFRVTGRIALGVLRFILHVRAFVFAVD
jgi:hypothetical protein